jgi:N-acetylmuramoyl-L-alanine amidase
VSAAARLGLALALPALLGAARPEGLGDVKDVRHWSYEGYTRVVIETSSRVHTKVERLGADPAAGRPERLFVDLGGVWVGTRYSAPIPVSDGLLQAVRVGQNSLSAARVVLDLERYERHRLLHLSGPPRVVIDVFGPRAPEAHPPGAGREPRRGGSGAAAPPPGAPRLSAELRAVRTVVVDPGHGGSDPGATGVGGIQEKLVTLRVARALRPKLEAQGLRVVLTREGDRSLTLEERTAIAEGVRGDLFLSIHANAAPRPQLQGIETYYLDKGHERHTLRVAAHENGVRAADLDPLQRTLASFRVSQSSEQSALLAAAVHGELVSGVRGRFGEARDLGVKTGPFYVLFLSSMPSILIEAGFLTHREEARRLASPAYAELVAEQIARGVARYRERRGTLLAGRLP